MKENTASRVPLGLTRRRLGEILIGRVLAEADLKSDVTARESGEDGTILVSQGW